MLRECSSTELAANLHLADQRIPFEGLLELTARCNLDCAHCYINLPMAGPARNNELSTDRLLRLVGEIAEAGGLFLTLSGGEALAREDFPEIYLQALRAGLIVSVFTNGTLVTERMADLFDENRPQLIDITLYGASPETYERVTGVRGSFARCMAGVRRLSERGIDLRLKTMVLSWNAHELVAMQAIADELGVPFRTDGALNPRIDGGSSCHQELQVGADELVALESLLPSHRDEMLAAMNPRREAARHSVDLYECGAGRTGYTIEASGRLLLCELSRKNGIDLRQMSFGEAWKELGPLRMGTLSPESPCFGCDLRPLCGSCAGANELASGDAQKPVTVFCQLTHRRAADLWGEASGHRQDASCCLGRHDVKTVPRNGLIQITRAPRRTSPAL